MRSVCAFRILTLAVPVAVLACGTSRDREAEAPTNTATYEPPSAATAQPMTDDSLTPASGINEPRETMPAPETQGAAPQQMEQASMLSDEQIAAVTNAAHTAEVDAAQYVVGKTKNARLRKFAQTMVDHHKKAKADQSKLMTKLGMTPAESQKLRQLTTSASDTDRTLRAAPDDMLDKTFIDMQVADHQMMLDLLDRDFIPNVDNVEFKKALADFRPRIEAHLREALEIQKALMSAPPKKSSGASGSDSTSPSGTEGARGTSGTGTKPEHDTKDPSGHPSSK